MVFKSRSSTQSGGGGGVTSIGGLTGTVLLGANLSVSGQTINATGGGGGGSPAGSTGNVQFNNAGSFAADGTVNIDQSGTVTSGTNLNAAQLIATIDNTNYDDSYDSAAVIINNPDSFGQNIVNSYIGGQSVAKWRTDYAGNISWVAGNTTLNPDGTGTGGHGFYIGGDYPNGIVTLSLAPNYTVAVTDVNGYNVRTVPFIVGNANGSGTTGGSMGLPYEVCAFERYGDTKFGVYSSDDSGSTAASFVLGATNFTNDQGYYPSVEMQASLNSAWGDDFTWFNALLRDADGNVQSSNVGLIKIYSQSGFIGFGAGTNTPTEIAHVFGNLRVQGAYKDSSNSAGTSGYYLKSTGTGTAWTVLPVSPANTTATTHQFFTAYNSTTGVFTKAQPATSDLSDIGTFSLNTTGTATASNLSGTNTGNVTLGTANGLSLSGQALSLAAASTSTTGALTSTDWNTFNGKQGAITLTTAGTSGAATFSAGILNVPNYANTTYTASTGLTLTGTAFSVNTSQNITTLSNLTTAGFVTTTTGGLLGSRLLASGDIPNNAANTTGQAGTVNTVAGNISAGTNITFTGAGTLASPYTIAASGGGTGTVTTTGTPSSGNLTKFSGSTSITNADLTGDITTSGGVATTLATVNTNTGSFGSSTAIPNFTVNGKGLITAAGTNVVIAPAGTLSGTTLNSTVVTSSLTSLGTQSAALNMGSHQINSLLDPTSAQDAATKAYVDNAVIGLLDYRGSYDASTNLYPATGGSGLAGAILKGDFWVCSVAGTLGGTAVTPSDLIIALVDTPGQTSANWDLIAHDLGSYVTSVTGTTNRITSSGGSTPAIDISASYVGQSSLTTLGTITTGTWNGSTVPVAYGGTGTTTSTGSGAVVLASSPTLTTPALGTPSALVGTNITGTASSLTAGTVSTISGLISAGTNVTVTGSGTSGSPYVIAASGGGGGGITYSTVTANTTGATNNGYVANASSQITISLPTVAAQYDLFEVIGIGTGGWKITQATGQSILTSTGTTTAGTSGFLSNNTNPSVPMSNVRLLCTTANTTFKVIYSDGQLLGN